MSKSTQLAFLRRISISQQSVISVLSKTTPLQTHAVPAPELERSEAPQIALENPQFKALNQPASALSVRIPASYPIHIRRGGLLALYGAEGVSGLSNITSSSLFLDPIKALFNAFSVLRFQTIVGTLPFLVLLSSSGSEWWFRRGSATRTLSTLQLDGTRDWAILEPSALQAYSGPLLRLAVHRSPRHISRKLALQAQLPARTQTGIARAIIGAGHIYLTGRGDVVVAGNESIYQLTLEEGEETLVDHRCLLAVTVNGPHDLRNTFAHYEVGKGSAASAGAPLTPNVEQVSPNVVQTGKSFAAWAQYLVNKASRGFKTTKNWIYSLLVGSGGRYVRVFGPRQILLQTSGSPIYSGELGTELQASERQLATDNTVRKAGDYLSYVTITDKGAVFENTPNFQETVKQIESKKTR